MEIAELAERLGRIGHVVIDRTGELTGAIYMERVTWSDGKEETVTRTVRREDMPAKDVEACEEMLAMQAAQRRAEPLRAGWFGAPKA